VQRLTSRPRERMGTALEGLNSLKNSRKS
jgi:hypothetical protein